MPYESFKPYTAPAAGWGALKSVAQSCLREGSPVPRLRALLKTNQDKGFDCPGCAWGEKPGHEQAFKFCENGAKAVNWEASRRSVDATFFARHSVTELAAQSDHWLEAQGRLTEPMRYNAATDHYEPIDWDRAFGLIAEHLKALPSPDQAAFYTSGRASNEAAFLYQLMVRAYGTNNLPDCSNMCHEASGVALKESIGVAKGTVTLEDFERADLLFVIGQNPGTNHPRMLEVLRDAVARGAEVVVINPLKERGLERFQHPQSPTEMLSNRAKPTHTHYLRPRLGGDMAIMRGVAKALFQWDAQAKVSGRSSPLDHNFLSQHTQGITAYRKEVEDTSWEQIVAQSGLERDAIEGIAHLYSAARSTIFCWAMGITQHQHSVAMIQEFTNVLLLRGQIGRPGAGVCPVRGHSNVQGDRTMGIHERPPEELLNSLAERFAFSPPRRSGFNTVETIHAMEDGRLQVFVGLGGNFAQATPDQIRTHAALRRCALTAQISTKLNRSHLVIGREALILPCLGRTDQDLQAFGPQSVTVEDSFSMVHASCGVLPPLSSAMRSEPAIIAGIAQALLGDQPVPWLWLIEDYSRIRTLIEETIPGFRDFDRRIQLPGGFYLGNSARDRQWKTASGKAQFMAHVLPAHLDDKEKPVLLHNDGDATDLLITLQSIRSHDQYNTSVYSLNDRYRGISGQRDVVFLNPEDMQALGIREEDRIDLVSVWADGHERRLHAFKALPFDIPRGQAAAYYPEVNPLIALESHGDRSFTPTSKFIPVRIRRPERN